jgi:hypothetical protein
MPSIAVRRALATSFWMAVVSCAPESRLESAGDGGDDAPSNGKGGGAPEQGGSSGAVPTRGSGGSAGGAAGTASTGKGGQGGTNVTGGNGGTGDEGGVGGVAGEGPVCPSNGTSCPSGCFELPVVTGCGDDAKHSVLCSETEVTGTALDCGTRIEDGAIFYVDTDVATTGFAPSPFAAIEGFRACTPFEAIDASCNRITTEPSVVTVRFDVTNRRTSPIWIISDGMSCEALRVARSSGGTLLLGAPTWCVVPCLFPNTDPSGNYTVTRIEPGATFSIPWDGREVRQFDAASPCAQNSGICQGTASVPAPAGRYRAGFVVETDTNSMRYQAYAQACGASATCSGGGPYLQHSLVGLACLQNDATAPVVNVEFDLPASGELVVPVPIE